jgi:hypothetical protein
MGVRRRLARVERPDRGWEALTVSELAVVELARIAADHSGQAG